MPGLLSHIYLVLLNNLYPPQRASGKSFFTKLALLQGCIKLGTRGKGLGQ